MSDIEEIRERLDRIEETIGERPGDAQAELEALTPEIGELIAERQTNARRSMADEDFVGAAHVLTENASLLQRTANLVLELREQVRRRR
jgi:predicted  nucleic acid-binding Zn-ribbon protein